MATLPTLFLESTLHAAKEHDIEAHTLPDSKGLLLFPKEVAVSEQCSLLKKMAADLQTSQYSQDPAEQQPESTFNPSGQNTIDCQVSVEERAQLFKFLTG